MTIFEADINIAVGDVQVEVLDVHPTNADPINVEMAREAIRLGAEKVLRPRGTGAFIRVKRVVIHPIDFNPRRFERHTAEEIERLLGDAS